MMERVKGRLCLALCLIATACFMLVAILALANRPERVYAMEEDAAKAATTVKVSFAIPEEARVGGSLAAGAGINRAVSFYNWIGGNNGALEEGSKLIYEVYSPTPVAGLGGFSGYEQDGTWASWDTLYEQETDQNGYSALSSADLSEVIGNGWYRREIALGEQLTVKQPSGQGGNASSHWGAYLETVAPVAYDKLDVYFRNAHVVNAKGEIQFYCFYNGNDRQAVSLYNVKPPQEAKGATSGYYPSDGPDVEKVSEDGGATFVNRIKAGVEYAEIDPPTLKQTVRTGAVNTDVDLSKMVDLAGSTLTGVAVTDEEGAQVPVNGSKINVESAGAYRVAYSAVKDGLALHFNTVVYLLSPDMPVILPEDTALIPRTFADREQDIVLPAVKVYYRGEELNAELAVTDPDGAEVTVREGEESLTFTALKCGVYRVRYFYTDPEDEAKTVSTEEIEVLVGVASIDLSKLAKGTLGVEYSLADVMLDDPERGPTALSSIEVIGPDRGTVTVEGGKFLPVLAGEYRIVCSAADYRGETVTEETVVTVEGANEMTVKVSVRVPEQFRAAGIAKYAVIRLFDDYRFNAMTSRDTFSYDIYMPQPIPGVGLVSMLEDGEGPMGSGTWDYFGNTESTDADGIPIAETADLTAKLVSGGRPVWHTRSFQMPAGWAGMDIRDFTLAINTTAACGETIDVYLKNIKFIRSDDSVINVFTGAERLVKSSVVWDGSPAWATGNLSAFVTVDEFPMVNAAVLPKGGLINAGERYVIPSNLLYDYQDGATVSASYSLTGPDGASVPVTDGTFTPTQTGDYVLTAVGTDSDGNTATRTVVFTSVDTVPPLIGTPELPKEVKRGSKVVIPAIPVTDNQTAFEDIRVAVSVTAPDGSAVTVEDNTFIADQLGTYVIKVTARDKANNSESATFEIAVVKGANVGLIVGLSVGGAVVVAAAIAVALIVKKKKKA